MLRRVEEFVESCIWDVFEDSSIFKGYNLLLKMQERVKNIDIQKYKDKLIFDLNELFRIEASLDLDHKLDDDFPLLKGKNVIRQAAVMSLYMNDKKGCGKRERNIIYYTLKTREINFIFDLLTKKYCKDDCEFGEYGCCFGDDNLFSVNPRSRELISFAELQMIEGKIDENMYTGCKFHSMDYGCGLNLLKPPLCLGHICESLSDVIKSKYRSYGREFVNMLSSLALDFYIDDKSKINNVVSCGSKILFNYFPTIVERKEQVEVVRY